MPRPMITLTALAACAALLAGACGSSSDSSGSGDDGRTLVRVQAAGEPDEVANVQLVIDAFEAENPDIDLELTAIPKKPDHIAKLVTAFAGGTPPDVFLLNYREYAQFATRGAMLPADRDALDEGFYDVVLDAFTYDGDLQCVPQNISSLVVYWNKAIFSAAGIDPPADTWTWDDFRAVAARLTGEDLRGAGIEASLPRLAPLVWSAGGEIVDDQENPTRLTLDTPEGRAALEYLVALARDDQSIPTEEELAAMGLEEQFAAGRLAMLLDSRKVTPGLREVRTLDWDVAALPTVDEPASILHSDGYCIAAETDVADAARRFVAFATDTTGQSIGALSGRLVPAIESVAKGAFLDPTSLPESDQVFLDAIPLLRATPVIPTWPEIEDIAEEVLTRAFYEDGYTIDDALADLDDRTTPLFAEAAAE